MKPLLMSVMLACSTAFVTPAYSAGVPTVDVLANAALGRILAETKIQLAKQIEENLKLDQQLVEQIKQLQTLKNQYDALTVGLDLSDLNIEDLLAKILPKYGNLTDAVSNAKNGDWSGVITSGKVGGQNINAHVTGIFGDVGMSKADVDTLARSEDPSTARIGTQANTGAFLSVAAEASSEQATESLKRIDGLVNQIPSMKGLREAIDLNTRVTAELGIALANIWSMEAIQTIGMGEAGVMDAATAASEEKYLTLGTSSNAN